MSTWIHSLLLAGLATGAFFLHRQNDELQERLRNLEGELAAVEAVVPAMVDGPREGAVLEPGVKALDPVRTRQRLEEMEARIAQAEVRQEQAADAAATAPGPADDAALDRKVREVVLDMAGDVVFRSKLGLRGSPNLPKKPAFGQLAEALSLDAVQEETFRKDLMVLKEDVMALLSEERDDGVVPLEEIQKAEALPEGDPGRAKVFIRLFTLKIPGTEETYMNRVVDLTARFKKETQRYLRAEQTQVFNAMDVDLLGVEME